MTPCKSGGWETGTDELLHMDFKVKLERASERAITVLLELIETKASIGLLCCWAICSENPYANHVQKYRDLRPPQDRLDSPRPPQDCPGPVPRPPKIA